MTTVKTADHPNLTSALIEAINNATDKPETEFQYTYDEETRSIFTPSQDAHGNPTTKTFVQFKIEGTSKTAQSIRRANAVKIVDALNNQHELVVALVDMLENGDAWSRKKARSALHKVGVMI